MRGKAPKRRGRTNQKNNYCSRKGKIAQRACKYSIL